MKIGFVCTNYNNAAFTRAAVESLRHGQDPNIPIVVVDNASGDADAAELRRLAADFSDVDVVFRGANIGYFPGLNVGLDRLRERHGDVAVAVIGNNDLVFPPDFTTTLRKFGDVFDTWAVVAPDLVTPDGMHQNPHVRFPVSAVRKRIWDLYYSAYPLAVALMHVARLTGRFGARSENVPGADVYKTAGPVEQGYGACYFLGPVFFRHFTHLCAPTFLLHEEFFLYEQLKLIGQLTWYDPRFVVQHRGHGATRAIPARRRWQLGTEAHWIYKRFLAMSAAEQRTFLQRHAMRPA